jgi:hypothetical protein
VKRKYRLRKKINEEAEKEKEIGLKRSHGENWD